MKARPQVQHRARLHRNPQISGTVYRVTKAQMKALGARIGDRVWVTLRSGRITFTRHGTGPRPAEGRISRRLRRTRPGRVRQEPALWWRALQEGRQRYFDTLPRDGRAVGRAGLRGSTLASNSAGTATPRLVASA